MSDSLIVQFVGYEVSPVARAYRFSVREPKSEPLLPDTKRTLKQEGLRQPAGGDGACQPTAKRLVAVQRAQRHAAI